MSSPFINVYCVTNDTSMMMMMKKGHPEQVSGRAPFSAAIAAMQQYHQKCTGTSVACIQPVKRQLVLFMIFIIQKAKRPR